MEDRMVLISEIAAAYWRNNASSSWAPSADEASLLTGVDERGGTSEVYYQTELFIFTGR